jgi:hypothetical protein
MASAPDPSCAMAREARRPLLKEAAAIVGVSPSHLRREREELGII